MQGGRFMINEKDAAQYILSLDTEGKYFNHDTITLNGRSFYIGNARLNKILHLAQNAYIGKTGKLLFPSPFYAYDNGGVVLTVQESYIMLLALKDRWISNIAENIKIYLRKMFTILKDVPIEELIEIDHEDPAWEEKHHHYYKEDQVMEPLKYVKDYEERYQDINYYMDNLME